MRALLVASVCVLAPAFHAFAATPVVTAEEELEGSAPVAPRIRLVQDATEVQSDGSATDTANQIGKGILRIFLTGLTTCGGLSMCTASIMGCGTSVFLLIYGLQQPAFLVVGGVGIGLSLLLALGVLVVVLPISFVLRYFGLWDTWTEQFVFSIFQILLVAI